MGGGWSLVGVPVVSVASQPQPAPKTEDEPRTPWWRPLAVQAALGAVAMGWTLVGGLGVAGLMLFYWLETVFLFTAYWIVLLLTPPPDGARGEKIAIVLAFPAFFGLFLVGHAEVLMKIFPATIGRPGIFAAVWGLGAIPVLAVAVLIIVPPVLDQVRGTTNFPRLDLHPLRWRFMAVYGTMIVGAVVASRTGTGMTIAAVAGIVFAKLFGEWHIIRRQMRAARQAGTA